MKAVGCISTVLLLLLPTAVNAGAAAVLVGGGEGIDGNTNRQTNSRLKGTTKKSLPRVLKGGGDDGGGDGDGDDGGGEDNNVPDIDLGEIVGFSCFSERATVQVEGYSDPISVKDLRVGDSVLTPSHTYSKVYAFGHYHKEKVGEFVQLETRKGVVELTPEHMVYRNGHRHPVRADSIQPGDFLKGKSMGLKVLTVDRVKREGVYAPLTEEGTLLVNGIAASSYISLQENAPEYVELHNGWKLMSQHDYNHMGMSPMRLFCLGVVPSLCNTSFNSEEGLPAYVQFAIHFNQDVHSQSIVVQSLVLLGVILCAGLCQFLEFCLGATRAPTVLFLVGCIYAICRQLGVFFRVKVKFPSSR